MNGNPTPRAVTLVLIATEESGDLLGAGLMRALRHRLGAGVQFAGVGGRQMEAEGLRSLFPIEQLSVMGFVAVAKKLPFILRLIGQTADAAIAAAPDMVIIIDSPEFTHRVARKIRARRPDIPIVDYVSPSVWAWRPGRARKMRAYVDRVLTLLPFEAEAHRRLGGPPCSFVGHPLIEELATLRPNAQEIARRQAKPPVLLVLPGSRRAEIRHHMAVFGEVLRRLNAEGLAFEAVLPTMPHLEAIVAEEAGRWSAPLPRIVIGEDAKRASFRIAHAALAKSGTVTLELALAGVPMVAAYRLSGFETAVGKLVVNIPTVILANLVIGENVVPEFILRDCTADKITPALRDVLGDTPLRRRQAEAFRRLDDIMLVNDRSPSEKAAEIVLEMLSTAPRAPD